MENVGLVSHTKSQPVTAMAAHLAYARFKSIWKSQANASCALNILMEMTRNVCLRNVDSHSSLRVMAFVGLVKNILIEIKLGKHAYLTIAMGYNFLMLMELAHSAMNMSTKMTQEKNVYQTLAQTHKFYKQQELVKIVKSILILMPLA